MFEIEFLHEPSWDLPEIYFFSKLRLFTEPSKAGMTFIVNDFSTSSSSKRSDYGLKAFEKKNMQHVL